MNQEKLQQKLRKQTAQAITQYNMIEEGDRVMVCLSGGKDSYTMLDTYCTFNKLPPLTLPSLQ